MDRSRIRTIFQNQIQETLAERRVQITALPSDQLNALVDAVADSVFAVLDAIEDDDVYPESGASASMAYQSARQAAPASASSDHEERLLWKGRPYLSIGLRYELTSERLRIIRGLLGHSLEEIELVRVRDTKVKQHVGERAVNVGDITVLSNDPSTPEITLHNVKDPKEVRELIRKAVIAEKERRGLHYREEM